MSWKRTQENLLNRDSLETLPGGSGIKEKMKEGPNEEGDTRGKTDSESCGTGRKSRVTGQS